MDSPADPAETPWHRRVLDWLGMGPAGSDEVPRLPDPAERFPWEPLPPAPRPPQWGAADQPELLLGSVDGTADAGPPAAGAATGLPELMRLPGAQAA
ncbi:hypothetical protein [Azohydromonas aeria]|uniref:hypothetical protein n=1 Tax=Azohydromonas aeria TaxID=2590212 RepID=UPI0012FB553C|nr:hypothetical protein [Azohydromonas aeria]